jgi:hypothetical protein
MNTAEKNLAILQTAELMMLEIQASSPCSVRHVRNYLIDQCSFGYAYMGEALDYLIMREEITVEGETVELI